MALSIGTSVSRRQIMTDNPDEGVEAITPYRTNALVVSVPSTPINWGPLRRSGKVSLVALPFVTPFFMPMAWQTAAALVVCYLLSTILALLPMSDIYEKNSRMAIAIRTAWWPLMVLSIPFRRSFWEGVSVPFKALIRYIRTGE